MNEDDKSADITNPKDHKIGYGNPPKNSQFKKNQSGNPKGRPNGSNNLNKILEKLGLEKVSVTENGTKKFMTKIELVLASMMNKASKGDVAAARLLVSVSQMSGAVDNSEYEQPYSEVDHKLVLEEAEWQVYLNKYKGGEGDE
ncbi:DUF5681 domain-containing protein [Falsihalocynthiibacter sp. BN13B15]|uniref:DUF5681 domain-containing protein n=1 Tax=Falsihalocynthiibacter sp. BN13B15 TaxID=3240871 RepID=UPI00350FE38C